MGFFSENERSRGFHVIEIYRYMLLSTRKPDNVYVLLSHFIKIRHYSFIHLLILKWTN